MTSPGSSFVRLARLALLCAAALTFLVPGETCWAAQSATGQWIVVTPPECEAILAPLLERRRAEGFQVVVLKTTELLTAEQLQRGDGAPLRARLEELTKTAAGPSYVLLAGNIGPATETNATAPMVPSLRGRTGRMAGQPSDFGYALPGADGLPSLRVGRFPARNDEELRGMVRKTLAFEWETPPGTWQNRLLLLVGEPGGGVWGDMFMQRNLKAHLAILHPAWQVRALANIESSPYYLPPPQDRSIALRYLGEGYQFCVYLGHSWAGGMGLERQFLLRRDWSDLNKPDFAGGPFFTVGCFACQSSREGDGYGLAAMRNPAGPVAVIGASGESYSATGQLAVEGLLSCLTQPPFPTRLGDYWLAVQAGLVRGSMDPATFALLDGLDGSGGKVPLATQRLEHLEMWMLLGDPALRLHTVPLDIALRSVEAVVPGKTIEVRGSVPPRLSNASVRLSLERPLNSSPPDLDKVPQKSPQNRDARQHAFASNHLRANSFDLASLEVRVSGNEFAASLPAPANIPWTNLVLRAWATAGFESGAGVLTLSVRHQSPLPATSDSDNKKANIERPTSNIER
jgi:hypothetical protein